jgi:hypothetical protein
VRPFQPEGVWEEIFMGRFTYEPSEGSAQFRRTLYAFWRRSIAPTFLFDSAQRRVCEVGMTRTNTPLQALTLLNDRTIFTAALELAGQVKALPDDDALARMHERVLARRPSEAELAVLRRELERATGHYRRHPQEAAAYLGEASVDSSDTARLAACCLVATLILNLDEAVTHE